LGLGGGILGPVLEPVAAWTAVTARAILPRGGGRRGRPILRLLQAEPEAMALRVEADDPQLDLLALLDDVAGVGDALVGQLADVDQSLEALLDANERAEVDELGDRAVDDVADLVLGDRL